MIFKMVQKSQNLLADLTRLSYLAELSCSSVVATRGLYWRWA